MIGTGRAGGYSRRVLDPENGGSNPSPVSIFAELRELAEDGYGRDALAVGAVFPHRGPYAVPDALALADEGYFCDTGRCALCGARPLGSCE